jgi:hypothetical protein
MTPIWTWLRRSGPYLSRKQKNKSPLAHLFICLAPDIAWSLIRLRPFCTHQLLRHALSLPLSTPSSVAPHAYPSQLHCSLPRRSSPSPSCATDLAMTAGAHVSWRLRFFPAESRAPMSVVVASGAHAW